MTRDDVIRMAREVGILMVSHRHQDAATKLERFAELVAAAEREECAKLCESLNVLKAATPYDWTRTVGQDAAAAIRARGDA